MTDETLARVAQATHLHLERFFEKMRIEPISKMFETRARSVVYDQVEQMTLRGGKRFRAALLIEAAALFDEDAPVRECVLDAAAALELLQTYFLIHDDIMDEDATRRGGPSAHVALADSSGDPQIGRNLAILAGDCAAALHQIILSRIETPDSVQRRVGRIFADMHMDVIMGQVHDVLENTDPMEIASHKTASYTTVGPLSAGAVLGGADDEAVEILARAGRPLGIAFQLRDDLLGTFGDEAQTGKPVGTDIRLGKHTFVIRTALAQADARQRALLEETLGNAQAGAEELEQAQRIIESTGARRSCEERIEEMASRFAQVIRAGDYAPAAKDFMLHVAELLTKRDR